MAATSCHNPHLHHQAPDMGADRNTINLHLQSRADDDKLINKSVKSTASAFELQNVHECKLQFIFASSCTSKHLSLRHSEAYTEVTGEASCTLHIFFKHKCWSLIGCSTSAFTSVNHTYEISEQNPQ